MQIPGGRSWAGCQHHQELNGFRLEDRNSQKLFIRRLSWEYFSPQILHLGAGACGLWHLCARVSHTSQAPAFSRLALEVLT